MKIERSNKLVATWIFVGIGMLIIQVLLGGITRLSGSGLSITEWRPIMGFMLPTSELQWQVLFEKYQQIAQYKYINNHFTISDFKFIFFWEWFHRVWARLIAIAFAIPFVYFIIKKHIKPNMVKPLIILVLMGALEGALGWIMVKSGLNAENVYVNHIKLSVHFVFAMAIISYALSIGIKLISNSVEFVLDNKLRKQTLYIIIIVFIQLMYGAFMAGLKAANHAPTWPLINGDVFPETLYKNNMMDTLFFNSISIHFIHRLLAYIIFIVIFSWWSKARQIKTSTSFNAIKNYPYYLVFIEVLLGITALLVSKHIVLGGFGFFEWIALSHQLVGMLLLLSLVANYCMLSRIKNNHLSS